MKLDRTDRRILKLMQRNGRISNLELAEAVETLLGQRMIDRIFDDQTFVAIRAIGASEDPRAAWWLTDLLRIARSPDLAATISGSLSQLLGVGFDPFDAWGDAVDHLIAWDINDRWSLWIGYRVVGVGNIAQADEQWPATIPASAASLQGVTAGSDSIIHGGFAGFESRY